MMSHPFPVLHPQLPPPKHPKLFPPQQQSRRIKKIMLHPLLPPDVHSQPQFVAAKSLILCSSKDFVYTPSYEFLLATVSKNFKFFYDMFFSKWDALMSFNRE